MPDTQQPDLFLSVAATRAGEAAVLGIVEHLFPGIGAALQEVELAEIGIKGKLRGGATAVVSVTIQDG